jgi:hypothetical protein
LRENKRDLQIGYIPIKVENKLPRVLAASGIRLVPKIGIDGDVHNFNVLGDSSIEMVYAKSVPAKANTTISAKAYYTEWLLFCEDEFICFIKNNCIGQLMLQG